MRLESKVVTSCCKSDLVQEARGRLLFVPTSLTPVVCLFSYRQVFLCTAREQAIRSQVVPLLATPGHYINTELFPFTRDGPVIVNLLLAGRILPDPSFHVHHITYSPPSKRRDASLRPLSICQHFQKKANMSPLWTGSCTDTDTTMP